VLTGCATLRRKSGFRLHLLARLLEIKLVGDASPRSGNRDGVPAPLALGNGFGDGGGGWSHPTLKQKLCTIKSAMLIPKTTLTVTLEKGVNHEAVVLSPDVITEFWGSFGNMPPHHLGSAPEDYSGLGKSVKREASYLDN
jgi:hypothetical protein